MIPAYEAGCTGLEGQERDHKVSAPHHWAHRGLAGLSPRTALPSPMRPVGSSWSAWRTVPAPAARAAYRSRAGRPRPQARRGADGQRPGPARGGTATTAGSTSRSTSPGPRRRLDQRWPLLPARRRPEPAGRRRRRAAARVGAPAGALGDHDGLRSPARPRRGSRVPHWPAGLRTSDRVKASVKEKTDDELLDHYGSRSGALLTNLGVLCVGRPHRPRPAGDARRSSRSSSTTSDGQKVDKLVWDDHTLRPSS